MLSPHKSIKETVILDTAVLVVIYCPPIRVLKRLFQFSEPKPVTLSYPVFGSPSSDLDHITSPNHTSRGGHEHYNQWKNQNKKEKQHPLATRLQFTVAIYNVLTSTHNFFVVNDCRGLPLLNMMSARRD